MARWLVKILKTLINTGKSGIVYCMQEIRWINFNMGCIETFLDMMLFCVFHKINFNMGCIETRQNGGTTATKPRLTLTWDVLKRVRVLPPFLIYWINFNMGCIETCNFKRCYRL